MATAEQIAAGRAFVLAQLADGKCSQSAAKRALAKPNRARGVPRAELLRRADERKVRALEIAQQGRAAVVAVVEHYRGQDRCKVADAATARRMLAVEAGLIRVWSRVKFESRYNPEGLTGIVVDVVRDESGGAEWYRVNSGGRQLSVAVQGTSTVYHSARVI